MGAPLNSAYFTNLNAQIEAASTCGELQLIATQAMGALNSLTASVTAQTAIIQPALALLSVPDSPSGVVTWVASFISEYLSPQLAAYTSYAAQLAALAIEAPLLVAAIESAASRIGLCTPTIPTFSPGTIPAPPMPPTYPNPFVGSGGTFTSATVVLDSAGNIIDVTSGGGVPGTGTVTGVSLAAASASSIAVVGASPVTVSGGWTLALDGDVATPGNSYYYGTDSGGTKGWYVLTGGGGSGTVTSVGLTVNATYLTIGGTASPITSTGTFTLDLSTAAKAALAVALTAIQPAEVTDSITWTGTDLALVGDVGSPGNNYYYGTNGIGVKGWYVISGGGGGSVSLSDGTNTISSVTTLLMLNGYAQSGGTGVGELYFPWSPDMPPVSPDVMNDEFDGSTLNARWTPWNIQSGNPLTYTIASSAITLNIPIDGGVSTRIWQGLSQPLPGSTPWGFIIKVRGAVLTSTYNYAGFIIANSSTLQGISYGLDWHSSYGEPCFFTGASPDFTAHTTNDVSHANANGGPIAPFGNQWYAQGSSTLNQITENASLIQTHWLAIVSDGNDLYYSVSLDGRNFSLLWSQSISSYFSAPPDLIIIGGESISASTPSIITLDYFRRFL